MGNKISENIDNISNSNKIISTVDKESTNLILRTLNKIINRKPRKQKKEMVLFFCAHNDDQLLGGGGTIRKYTDEEKEVFTYIFSFGETSHPHLKPNYVAKMREKESIKASEILGDKIQYFGVEEGKFLESVRISDISRIIKRKKPSKIFTHAPDDPHPDHQAVFKLVIEGIKQAKYKKDLFSFDIWNIFSLKTREFPKLFVNVSDTFKYKIKAFDEHKSQLSTKVTLGWSFYLKAIFNGWNNHCKYAELFHKIVVDDYSFPEIHKIKRIKIK